MNPFPFTQRRMAWRSCLLLLTLTCAGLQVAAQQNMAAMPAKSAAPETQVGDATQGLLSLQRSNSQASPVPRPIPGEIASRSYQRYLKSFEHPIPEKFNTTVKTSSGGEGGPSN